MTRQRNKLYLQMQNRLTCVAGSQGFRKFLGDMKENGGKITSVIRKKVLKVYL